MIYLLMEKKARTYEGLNSLDHWYTDVSRHWNEIKKGLKISKTLGLRSLRQRRTSRL
jgi:hypothetical protein